MTDFTTEPYLGRNAYNIPVSNSEIQTYKECPRKWFLQYYLGRGPKEKQLIGPLPLGSRVHQTLEDFYKSAGDKDPLDIYKKLVEEDYEQVELLGYDDDMKADFLKEADLGQIMLKGYFEWVKEENLDCNLETIGIEESLKVPMFDHKIILQGKIDRKVKDREDGHVSLLDYKTAQSFTMYEKTAHMSEQLRMYALLERLLNKDEYIDGGIYRILRKVKRTRGHDFYREMTVRLTEEDLQQYYRSINVVLRHMIHTRDLLDAGYNHHDVVWKNFNETCSWKCPFVHVCPLMDKDSLWEMWFDSHTQVIDPYERYKQ